MKLQTASSVISFARKLEEEGVKYYQQLAESYPRNREIFGGFANDNRKFIVQTERAYYGVISDALEGCFAFDIDPDMYAIETACAEDKSYTYDRDKAIEIEEVTARFYADAAEQSQSLMADVPRTFSIIANKRSSRIANLKSL